MASADPQRRIDVEWALIEGLVYPVRIQVTLRDRPGALADLSGAIAEAQANITQAKVDVTPDGRGVSEFTIHVTDKTHLQQIIQRLRKIKWVHKVRRLS